MTIINDELESIKSQLSKLETISIGAKLLGLKELSEKLEDIVYYINGSVNKIATQYHNEIIERYNISQQTSTTILEATLDGIELQKPVIKNVD
jgi:hypothetical protein